MLYNEFTCTRDRAILYCIAMVLKDRVVTLGMALVSGRGVNKTLHDETETFKKHVSRRPRPRRSRHETETLTETFTLKLVYICKF